MKNLSFTHKERKVVIVLMIINCFALFVNYFGISYRFGKTAHLFTNSNGISGKPIYFPYDVLYEHNTKHFYPLVDFTYNSNLHGFFFKGIFAYYDMTEFFVYTLLIFGFILIRKIW